MSAFSCPRCKKLIEYVPPPGWNIVWVDKGYKDWGNLYCSNRRSVGYMVRNLKEKTGISSIEYVVTDCPHCEGLLVVFLARNDNSFLSDSNDFSTEI